MQTTQTGSIVPPAQGKELPRIVFKVASAHIAGTFSIVASAELTPARAVTLRADQAPN